MPYFWFWIMVFLLLVAIFAWPAWPYSRERWGYGPSGASFVVFLVVLAAFWFGFVAVWWPWVPGAGSY